MTGFNFETHRDEHFERITHMLYDHRIVFEVDIRRPHYPVQNDVVYVISGETYRDMDITTIANKIDDLGLVDDAQVMQRYDMAPRNSGRYFHLGYEYVADPEIKDVRFNGPATIVFWTDGTKTVVKCSENDIFDPEKAIMMAMLKKKLGNPSKVRKFFKKWIPEPEFDYQESLEKILQYANNDWFKETIDRINKSLVDAAWNGGDENDGVH